VDLTLTGNVPLESGKFYVVALFTTETARRARQRKAGLAAAGHRSKHDFANLERAREVRSLNAARRRIERSRRDAQRVHTVICPHGSAFVWYCSRGLSG
jgi:hypothetical protein